jgi:hypothetical protein
MAAHSCSEYDIVLDRRDAAYYPGDVVSGRVVITTTAAMQCRGIRRASRAPTGSANVFVLPAYDASGGGTPAVAPGSAQMDRGGGSEEETKESPPEERAPKVEAEA